MLLPAGDDGGRVRGHGGLTRCLPEPVFQRIEQFADKGRAVDGAARFHPQAGGGHVQFAAAEKIRRLMAVDADADDAQPPGAAAFLLDEDAGDFFAGQQDIVGPFDAGRQGGVGLDRLGDGDRGRQRQQFGRDGWLPQDNRGQKAFAGPAVPGASAAAAAGRLRLGQHTQPVMRRIGRILPRDVIGRGGRREQYSPPPHPRIRASRFNPINIQGFKMHRYSLTNPVRSGIFKTGLL